MRVVDLSDRFDLCAIAKSERARSPLADTIDNKDRRTLKWRRIKATGGMRHVMLGNKQARPLAECSFDIFPETCLGTQHPRAVNSGEYKLMGLAPYGKPRYASLIRDELIDVKDVYADSGSDIKVTASASVSDGYHGGPPLSLMEHLVGKNVAEYVAME